jgi:hypothetical protein
VTTNRRSAQLLVATCTALTEAIARHMPPGAYRDFTVWACSPRNPRQREFLQATGILQLINMNTTLLSGLVTDERWPEMVRFCGAMNAYQVLEVISDNLAAGLGKPELDETDLQRRALIGAFNRAMIETLTPGRRRPAVLLLSGPARHAAQQSSGFEHSLASATHAGIAEEYALALQSHGLPVPPREELEFGLWHALVANVETCYELTDTMSGTATSSLLRQGLLDRYRAVDRTLYAEHLSRLELASLGAQTILVAPTLAFMVGALMEKIHPIDGYAEAVSSGWIGDVLADAALLVRMQNDIGTRLLRMPQVRQGGAINEIARRHGEGGLELLLHFGHDPVFTRLHKDVVNGESNVALWHARRAGDPAGVWLALAESLAYYSALYAQHSARLAEGLAALDDRLGDKRASTVIERLVRFHERMYSHPHTDLAGEYAV